MGRGAVNETFAVRQLRVAKGRSGSLATELRCHPNVRFSPDSDWTAPLRQVTRPATSEHPVRPPDVLWSKSQTHAWRDILPNIAAGVIMLVK